MPPLTGASPAPLTLVSTPHSIQPSRQSHGRVFKAAQGLAKRLRKWQPGARPASHEPFTLLRGEHESRVNKAARCRDRIAETASQLYANAGRPPDRAELAQLERNEAKLQGSTQVHASLRGVLLDRTIRAYLPETGARQAKHRTKALIEARQGPLGTGQPRGSALDALAHVLESAAALEASAGPVKALGREYRGSDGQVELSAQTVQDLVTLMNGMKMLRPHDQDAADFLYPAMKAMHEATAGTSSGAGGTPLLNLLRDLDGAKRDDPRSLRAQLTRRGGGLDFWLANNPPPSGEQSTAAARQGLVDDMNRLLDGLAGAARQVWHDTLRNRVPEWAGDAQAGLFQEAGVLYRSAQRWRDRGLARGTTDEILHASPAQAVGRLLEHAANQSLAGSAAPPAHLAPLLDGLKSRLDQVAERIDHALDATAGHASPGEIATLRQTLMRDVLEETGILGEIHRLRESGDPPPASAPPAARRGAADSHMVPPAFRPNSGQLHAKVVQSLKRAAGNAQRQIIKILAACPQTAYKPLSRHKLRALNEAYATLVELHGEVAAPTVWQRLLDGETMRLKDDDLRDLNSSVLRAQARGRADLTSKLDDPDARATGDKLLRDIWISVRTASAKRNAGPFLKTWCASLSTPAGMADGTALFLQVEDLLDRIGPLDDGVVKPAALLNAAMEELSNAELDALIASLAAAPGAAENTDTLRRQRTYAHAFLGQLYDAARAQAETRMDALCDSLVQDFRTDLFAQASQLHAMLDTPDARAANGPIGATLEQLIQDAVQHGRRIHECGEDTANALAGTRFLRTAHGYDVVRDLTRPLGQATARLHARLDAGMTEVGIPRFRSHAAAATWRDAAVDKILRDTFIWEKIDQAVWRHAPRDTLIPWDKPSLSAIGLRASLRRGGARASTTSTQSVDRDGFLKPKSIFNRAGTAPAPAVAEAHYTTVGLPSDASARPPSVATVHDDDRASTVISADSGYDDRGGSRLSLDSQRYDTLRKPAVPVRQAPPPPSPETRIARAVDPQLAAALRAALEQRHRGEWNPA